VVVRLGAISKSSLHAANGVDRIFLALGVACPERSELGLVHIGQFLPEILERVEKLLLWAALLRPSRKVWMTGAGVPFGAKIPTQK